MVDSSHLSLVKFSCHPFKVNNSYLSIVARTSHIIGINGTPHVPVIAKPLAQAVLPAAETEAV